MHRAAAYVTLLSWAALAGAFVLRRRPARAREVKRDRGWVLGLLLQAASIAIVFGAHRPVFTPILPLGQPLELALAVLAIALALGSVAILVASERVLGKQFAYQARLVEGHRLITEGPYRFVRHPMYAAVYLLALATALGWSHWAALAPFTLLYAAGTAVRVRSEERLLREAFGEEFERYTRRVPAVVPGLPRQKAE